MSTFLWIIIIGVFITSIASIKPRRSKSRYDYNEWFSKSLNAVQDLLDFLSKMQNDTDLCSFIESQKGAILRLNGKTITSPEEKLMHFLTMDVAKCYAILGYDPSAKDRRGIPMFVFYARLTEPETDITISNISDYRERCDEAYTKLMGQLQNSLKKSSDIFFVSEYLKHHNKDLLHEYVRILLQFGYAVAGAEGKVSDKDDTALDRVFNLLGES